MHWAVAAIRRAVRAWTCRAVASRKQAVAAGELRLRWSRWLRYLKRRRAMRQLATEVVRLGRRALARRQLLQWAECCKSLAQQRLHVRCAAMFRRRVLLHRVSTAWRSVARSRRIMRVRFAASRGHFRRRLVRSLFLGWAQAATAHRGLRAAARFRRRALLRVGFRLVAATQLRRRARVEAAASVGRLLAVWIQRVMLRRWQTHLRRGAVLRTSRIAAEGIRRRTLLRSTLGRWRHILRIRESLRERDVALRSATVAKVRMAVLGSWRNLLRNRRAHRKGAAQMMALVRRHVFLGPGWKRWAVNDEAGRAREERLGALARDAGAAQKERALRGAVRRWRGYAARSARLGESIDAVTRMSLRRRLWSALSILRSSALAASRCGGLRTIAEGRNRDRLARLGMKGLLEHVRN